MEGYSNGKRPVLKTGVHGASRYGGSSPLPSANLKGETMWVLTKEEIQDYIKRAEEITKELLKDPKARREFIYKLGMHTKKGKLKKQFRDD